MRILSQYESTKLNAGPKAKVDVEKIISANFNAKTQTLKIKKNLNNKFYHFRFNVRKVFFIIRNKSVKDIGIIQLPLFKNKKIEFHFEKSIGIIHDIDGLRQPNGYSLKDEINLYNKFDVLISHNKKMTKFLRDNNVVKPIIDLEIFDYMLSDTQENNMERDTTKKEIVFAGNLSKSEFLKELDEKKMKFNMNLYGVGEYNKNNTKFKYFGSFLPDDLPYKLEGTLGLVWDGNVSNDASNNRLLNYTKYNNPHKLSCYMAAGLPVIVWEQSACADFVKKNNVGYVISNLYDINNIDLSDYSIKLKNTKKIQEKVTNGYYTKKAIEKALKIIKE